MHREIAATPLERFAQAPDVLRASPSSDALRDAFRLDTKQRQRQSDGTISLEGRRFEVPARYRHFRELVVRYARWDLGRVHLVDARSDTVLAPLYPLDRGREAALVCGPPPSEPDGRISRIRLSGQWSYPKED